VHIDKLRELNSSSTSSRRSSVNRSVEILQSTVNLNSDNATAGAEALANLQGGNEIGASRGSREDALGSRGAPGHGECICFWNPDHIIEVFRPQQRRPGPDAAPFDMVRPWYAAR